MCFRNCPTDFMGVKSRGLLSLRTNLFLFFTNGGREHQTAQILRHAVSNHVIRTPYRDNRIQARRVQASGHPLGFCVAKSEQSKKTPRKFSKSRFPLASRYLFLSKPLRENTRAWLTRHRHGRAAGQPVAVGGQAGQVAVKRVTSRRAVPPSAAARLPG